jgi:hypothetical protein
MDILLLGILVPADHNDASYTNRQHSSAFPYVFKVVLIDVSATVLRTLAVTVVDRGEALLLQLSLDHS